MFWTVLEDLGLIALGALIAVPVVLYVLDRVMMSIISAHFWR